MTDEIIDDKIFHDFLLGLKNSKEEVKMINVPGLGLIEADAIKEAWLNTHNKITDKMKVRYS